MLFQSLATYKEAITLIDKAMLLPISMPLGDDDEENKEIEEKMKDLKKMVYNFKMQRSEILLRIGTIYRKNEGESESHKRKASTESPAVSIEGTPKRRTRTYVELEKVLKELGKVQPSESADNKLIEILFCCNGVKLYYIESNGEVVSSLEDFALRIVRLGGDFEKNLDETIFLQLIKCSESAIDIGEDVAEHKDEISISNDEAAGGIDETQAVDPSFIYPLIPGVSPCYRTKFNAYILPDLQSNDGSAIGLMIPADYDEIVLDILISILKGVVKEDGNVEFGDFSQIGREVVPRGKRSTGDAVSENIVTGATWISLGIVRTAQKTGEFIDYSTPFILSKIQKAPENAPQPSKKVCGVNYLERDDKKIVSISGTNKCRRC